MSNSVQVLVCADGRQREALVAAGFPDFAACPWLAVRQGAQEARDAMAQFKPEEAWVFSSEEVEGINLAAALKADAPHCRVYVAGCAETGSMRSRLQAAGLDGVLSQTAMAERLAERRRAAEPEAVQRRSEAERREEVSEGAGGSGFLLTVVSGSGGAGKSTVSTVLAHLGARRGLRTALIDADLQFGDLRELGGAAASLPLDGLVDGSASFPAECPEGVVLVEAPRRLELSEVLAERLGDVVEEALARFDLVVVNTGGSWTEHQVRLLERSAAAVFLVDQRASSVRACRHALDLCLRCGIATGSFMLALNRCTRHAPFTSIDVSSALQGAHVAELAEGGREVEELLGAGMAAQLVGAGNDLCLSADRLLDELLPTCASRGEQTSQRPGVIARFGARGPRARGGRGGRKAEERPGRRSRECRAATLEGR